MPTTLVAKLKFPNLFKPLGTIIQQNYWPFYLSESFSFVHFNMIHPVTRTPYSAFSIIFSDLENSLLITELLPYLAFWSQLFTFWPTLHSTPLCQCRKSWEVRLWQLHLLRECLDILPFLFPYLLQCQPLEVSMESF